ncbi:hypothetical protein [Limosilactobacillus vaginalis]|uniref:hypothetical protein n=1 Tax=Limosilactobacillus vaginalis TaxID=1633 RepID=UPI0025A3295E|nr:hypothetical protein [Limosilactobacillus vaginalis]MDM8222021.1 hypothetical protein [Limosilactobacillus vaginalis]
MPENNQASDKTKPEATGSSSTQPGSQAIDMNHTNVIVPHRISNHDKLVQTMVMVDGEWVNVNDTNDQKNVQEDMHKVNRVVTEAQKDIINAQNAADSAVKSADSAISASKVNSDAIAAQGEAISEAKIALDSAAAKIRADVARVQNEVNTAKTANETEAKSIRDDLKMANSSIATVKDHLGNVSSELDTYAKSAATQGHDITIIQQKQGQFEVDYAGTKGDVNQIKANIKGLSENLKNSEGDVASLQATAKELQSSMSDAEGNISNLQVTAKSYDKIFEDHLGRISKVEQTASELTNEFSDQQGHLNRVEQTAQGTQQTVANQQGQINNIKTDAAGMHQTITGQGNQIANINVTLGGLSTKYEDVSGDLSKLKDSNQWKIVTGAFDANQYTQTARIFYQDTQAKNTPDPGWFYFIVEAPVNGRVTQNLIKDNSDDSWNRFYNGKWSEWTKGVTNLDITSLSDRVKTNSTQITQNKKEIDFKADQTEVDKVKGTVSQNSSRIDVMANEIKSKVDGTTVNNILDSKGYATMSYAQTLVKQTKDQWNVTATDLDTKIKDKDGINLLTGTADFTGNWFRCDDASWTDDNWRDTNGNRVRKRSGSARNGLGQTVHLEPGNYTFSMDMYLNLGTTDTLNFYAGDTQYNGTPNIVQLIDGNRYDHNSPQGSWFRAVCHFKVTKAGNVAIRPELNQDSGTVHVGSYKLEKGLIATPWTPAPSDNASVTQISSLQVSIDGIQGNVNNLKNDTSSRITQLSNTFQSKIGDAQISINDLKDKTLWKNTDSVDLNNVVTQQKIFVRGGSNLPPGSYWWYVQVEPGYDNRIVQYAVSDRDNLHYSRQYDGSKWSAWSQGATESEITQLRDDINLRVTKGDLLSQINVEAGRTLIQSNKIYFDADSFVMSPNSKAFIPSAFITDLSADKITSGTLDAGNIRVINLTADNIHGGTLDVGDMHVKNFTADDIETGTISTADIIVPSLKDYDSQVGLNGNRIIWAEAGNNSFGRKKPVATIYNENGGFLEIHSSGIAIGGDGVSYEGGKEGLSSLDFSFPTIPAPGLILNDGVYFDVLGNKTIQVDNSDMANASLIATTKTFITLGGARGIQAHLDETQHSHLDIQKDNHFGAYFGQGDNGNQINFNLGGDGCGFNVNGPLHVTGSKNSIVETRQGYLAINAYETAEYYFGDIGENNTGDTSQVVIGIDRIFNEVVNTDIQYQVFVTPYSNAHVWVEKRYNNRFIVKSDRPNAEFGWELKAKRKGYESNRLRRVNVDFNQMNLKGEN